MIWGGLWEIIFPSCWETTGNTSLAHRLFLFVLGYSLLLLSLALLFVTSKNFSFKGNSCSKGRWMGTELLLYNRGFLFHAPIWGCRHLTRNAKKAERCHRPEVSCGSVEIDHLVCQRELTKRPFHHVPIYRHTPLLAVHALELKQGKGTPKTVLFSFIFPWTHVSKLELCKSRKFCSMGNCFRLYWKSWDEKNNLEMFIFIFFRVLLI